jgi:UDP-N-acetylmuramoylalanine--D-glutamate ligase
VNTPDLSRVLVAGLGVTGRAVIEALKARNCQVLAVDDQPRSVAAVAEELRVEILDSSSATALERAFSGITSVVPSPGIPCHHLLYRLADTSGTEILSELDLAALWNDRPCAAVTGTNGKTTVTELTTQMLLGSGMQAAAVGNTETPFVSAIDDKENGYEVFVVEASSFGLDRVRRFRAKAAAWLNLAPDHLDWHGDFQAYATAKSNIWETQQAGDIAVAPHDDAAVGPWTKNISSRLLTFGLGKGDVHCTDRELIAHGERIVNISELRRSRPHDQLNACAATALALSMNASVQSVAEVLANFDGLAHRLEFVARVNGVRFFDDSKATTPHATVAGMGGFDQAVLIAGGSNKGLDLFELREVAPRLAGVVAIGETAETLTRVFDGIVTTITADSMEEAVYLATSVAKSSGGDVVLSPACASFDWYRNYNERGDDFQRVVQLLGQGQIQP